MSLPTPTSKLLFCRLYSSIEYLVIRSGNTYSNVLIVSSLCFVLIVRRSVRWGMSAKFDVPDVVSLG